MSAHLGERANVPDDGAKTSGAAPVRPTWRRPIVLVGAALLVLLLLTASAGAVVVERRRNATLTVPHGTITQDYGDFYLFRQRRSTINVLAAPMNRFGNLRVVFWGRDAVRSTDQQSCVTWATPDGRAQPGVALRITPAIGDASPRALIITQNLWSGLIWQFWLLEVSGHGKDPAGDRIASFDMLDSLSNMWGHLLPGPWRVCARVVGTDLSLKAWQVDQAEPSWDSPRVKHAKLPESWDVTGYPGGYIGHIKPDESFTFTDLEPKRLNAR